MTGSSELLITLQFSDLTADIKRSDKSLRFTKCHPTCDFRATLIWSYAPGLVVVSVDRQLRRMGGLWVLKTGY